MARAETSALLESIAATTRQQDSNDFRTSLLKTVMEAIPAERATFVRPLAAWLGEGWREDFLAMRVGSGDARELRFFAGGQLAPDAALRACVERGEACQLSLPDGRARYLLPVRDGAQISELVDIETTSRDPADFRLTSAIVQLYQNYLDLARAGERDTLTGLLNRRTLETRAGRLLKGAGVPQLPLPRDPARRRYDRDRGVPLKHWLAVIDIDHFKRINDRFGHLFGDEVLLLVARLMKECFRLEDLLFRFGGEEFVVIIDAVSEDDAIASFERFRKRISAHHFPQLDRVTVSIGYVQLGTQAVFGDAVGHADQALYQAKALGRDQICGYEQLLARHAIEQSALNSSVELF